MTLRHRNHIHIIGDGPATMVFAHGFGCDQNMWRLMEPLYGQRFRTLRFDLVGSGSSDLTAYDRDKYGSLEGYADDLIEILEKCTDEPVLFVGHSVSAMIGMLADLKAPGRFTAHVMIAPSPCYINHPGYVGGFSRDDIDSLLGTLEGNYLGWSSNMAPTIMGAPDQPALGEELANSFCRTDPDIAKHFARVTFLSDHRAELQHLKTPTLIVQCDDDIIAPVAVGEYMQREILNSTLAVIRNIGHCPHLSAPSACAEAMDRFLEQVAAH